MVNLSRLVDNLYVTIPRAEYNARGVIGEAVQRVREKAIDFDNVFFDKVGTYRDVRISAAQNMDKIKNAYRIVRDGLRTAVTEPKWRNFLIARGGISVISSTVGYYTGSTIDLSENAGVIDYVRNALPAAGPSLGTRMILEPFGMWFIYEANREKKLSTFIKDYLKMQSRFYVFDFLTAPITLAGVRYLGVPDRWSVYTNGKILAPFFITWNILLYKKRFVDNARKMLNGKTPKK